MPKYVKMKCLLPAVLWLWQLFSLVNAQGGIGFGIKREIFFLNLEDGYFGCQVNESTAVLQLYELSRLCDGKQDCYKGSDELRRELKCTDDCAAKEGTPCQNGVCLDSLCHCNDGYGGCSCQVPDENECKYRPCDVFAHCTNSLGSFTCSCFPGYVGDGFHCQDINECEDPAIASRCVQNAECCNLPSHFLCKCKPGFVGDGEVECKDVDECSRPDACGNNALCRNTPGNYTCECQPGFVGNPYDGCADVNECNVPNACGPGSLCTNFPGGHHCECPEGYAGDAYGPEGCHDVDECGRAPCGKDAVCHNSEGSFRCSCPPGFVGDPFQSCKDLDECESSPCGPNAECVNSMGNYTCVCAAGYAGSAGADGEGCADVNECARSGNTCGINAKCTNTPGSYTCTCPQGFTGSAIDYCQNINECERSPCGNNSICTDTVGSFVCSCKEDYTGDPTKGCHDIDECEILSKPCGSYAVCENTSPGYNCVCPQGFSGRPDAKVACEQVDVTVLCKSNFDCTTNAECTEGQCFCKNGFEAKGSVCVDIDECLAQPCGPFSMCKNTLGGFHCQCQTGYVGAPPRIPCKAPCEDVKCGTHAYCKPNGQEAYCMCEEGWTYNPNDLSLGCVDIDECDKVNGPFGRCGGNTLCTNTPGSFGCECKPGFTGNAFKQCTDINECSDTNSCGKDASCINLPGSFNCICPGGSVPDPDPFTKCTKVINCTADVECPGNSVCSNQKRCFCPEPNVGDDCRHPCEDMQCGPNSECMLSNNYAQCQCSAGYTGNSNTGCSDIDECKGNPCGPGAVCNNEPGSFSCQCPGGSNGDPFREGCAQTKKPSQCSAKSPCPGSEICVRDEFVAESVCICQRGYLRDPKTGKCRDANECTELRDKPACGLNAVCKNLPGSYECQCPPGFNGNPFSSCEECNTLECQCRPPYQIVNGECTLAGCNKGKCPAGAECVSIAGGVSYCACPKGYRPREDGSCYDVDECEEKIHSCGYGAECVNKPGTHECLCPNGYGGDPYHGCSRSQKKCVKDADCSINENCVQPGVCVCPVPYYTDVLDNNLCKSPCDRFPCGVNAQCTPSDPPKCLCLPGYKGDPLHGCEDVDECKDNPCALGSQCINEKGHYKCVCPHGTNGDPYSVGCLGKEAPEFECSTDDECVAQLSCVKGTCTNPCSLLPCGQNAHCESKDHAAWCRCSAGYVESIFGECVSPCEGYICGHGAQCIVTPQGPTCKCAEGSIGNPFAGGSCKPDACSSASPCAAPNVCVAGRCKEKCQDRFCGIGASCNHETNECVCNPLFVGDPDYLCMPPITMPSCHPGCGINAHCEYDVFDENKCVCNSGLVGNPYEECDSQPKKSCSNVTCGAGALCKEKLNSIECHCPPGSKGNPYVQCIDIDECLISACGNNAVCINTIGSYDCRCIEGYVGNPFLECSAKTPQICHDPLNCHCSKNVPCPPGYACKNGKCENQCENVKCGIRAGCVFGKCVCPPGLIGDPYDFKTGCKVQGQCSNDAECKDAEICFHMSKEQRKCVDGCSKLQCGPNAVCVTERHRSSCICTEGYFGNPGDLYLGCKLERVAPQGECRTDKDCNSPSEICSVVPDGISSCVSACDRVACGPDEICLLENNGTPVCSCRKGFAWNPIVSKCEKPSLPDCSVDADCNDDESCKPDALGVLKCISVCAELTCPLNSLCAASNHEGSCQCASGYEGNTNDRNGCHPIRKSSCLRDVECLPTEACLEDPANGSKSCRPVCDRTVCGQNSICVANNHVAQCQCPPGTFTGDPYDSHGCREVSCVYNDDCPQTQVCDRQSHTCMNLCDKGTCGTNAVCLADGHKLLCQCPPGFKPNPLAEISCEPAEVCNESSCHPTAICESNPASGYVCRCPPGHIGDAYADGCRKEGLCPNGNIDCPLLSVCQSGRCINPCEKSCGINTICNIIERKPVCSCPDNFEPIHGETKIGCVRSVTKCVNDLECKGGVCSNGECKVVCRNVDDCSTGERCVQNKCEIPCAAHSQCMSSQACVNGVCTLGCRSNKDCLSNESCINAKCQNPCKRDGVCGINSKCTAVDHNVVCTCNKDFQPNPVPEESCVRSNRICHDNAQCGLGQECNGNVCKIVCLSGMDCAEGERCTSNKCEKICFTASNCLTGEVCVEGICRQGCSSDSDCDVSQICVGNKCRCGNGYESSPIGCRDVDECVQNPCHPSARCVNAPGSFQCTCPEGKVGDPYTEPGCNKPNECKKHEDCAGNLACEKGKCTELCNDACGNNALCRMVEHVPACTCPPGYLGDAFDKTVGCFKVECLSNDDCPNDKACQTNSNKCTSPCDTINCGHGNCKAFKHKGVCTCHDGYELKNGKCQDADECEQQRPCHKTAKCVNTPPGSFTCVCPDGLLGDPNAEGCHYPTNCTVDNDCPESAVCHRDQCKSPCEDNNACGRNAVCSVQRHEIQCQCPSKTVGDPKVECLRIECTNSNDCSRGKTCVNSKCVNPCSVPKVCGENADCSVQHDAATCNCKAGYTGDPHLGCTSILYCASNSQCPTTTKCNNGICTVECNLARDCVGNELCIGGICQPTCRGNASCPEFQYCQNNICVQELRCLGNDNCDNAEICKTNTIGQTQCVDVCEEVICGRHAECSAVDHQPVCKCEPGYHGNPHVGCHKIECYESEDCTNDKICEDHMCKISCLANNPCGPNALCSAENHQQICYCQPGFTGDPYFGCDVLDLCEASPCGPGARCDNSRGSFKCLCPLGTVGDPYKDGCRSPVECQIDEDCPPAAHCVQTNGIPKCQDNCERVRCGPNAECGTSAHYGSCVCHSGYQGDPNDLIVGCRPRAVACTVNQQCPSNTYCYDGACKPSCVADAECALSEQCLQGQCNNPCERQGACGLNADCQVLDHVKHCSCPAGFTGSSEIECVRIPVACETNENCYPNSTCHQSVCQPDCQVDNHCALNEKCYKNHCALTCRVDNDCFLGHVCLNNMCLFGCKSNEDCASVESCRDNVCTNPCLAMPCGPNAVCTVANQRAVCSCRVGFVPNPTAKVACIRTPAEPCSENRECPAGYSCKDDSCQPVCTADATCHANEKCDVSVSVCKPLCRKDDDCRSGEICNGLVCNVGCRSDNDCPSDKSCVDNKCRDLCESPTACGVNALCSILNHQKQCSCPLSLDGDPLFACRYPLMSCNGNGDCNSGQTCYSSTCQVVCQTDAECLSDERCHGGICKAVCNSDSKCNPNQICENRLCIGGCRSDTSCPDNEACIDKQCRAPCDGATTCGPCAECKVVNHGVQCSCKAGFGGNPLIGCTKSALKCDGKCPCDSETGLCVKRCATNKDCACGETCHEDKCATKCSSSSTTCPAGHICSSAAAVCVVGCRTNADCAADRSCHNEKCRNPCDVRGTRCGKNSECRAIDHRAVCVCPDGFQGEPDAECVRYSCDRDEDCETNKKCGADRVCRNPCLEQGACGSNAQCRVVNRMAHCTCPLGYYGNAQLECKPGTADKCASNPCGQNSRCKDIPGGFECLCAPGCTGDPSKRCVCEQPQQRSDPCKNVVCGKRAMCQPVNDQDAKCYCPTEYPVGNPYVQCDMKKLPADCRTNGCGKGAECQPAEDGAYVCKCPPGTVGSPQKECALVVGCSAHYECPSEQACIANQCQNPCQHNNPCSSQQDCQVQDHQPVCLKLCQCQKNAHCQNGHVCDGCNCILATQDPAPIPGCEHCPTGVPCDPVTGACAKGAPSSVGCISNDDCQPSDSCLNRQCVNPCTVSNPCSSSALCTINNHKAVCKCPDGLTGDPFISCYKVPLTAPECTTDSECPSSKICANQYCQDPCQISKPCDPTAECTTINHRPVCNCPNGWAGNPQIQCYKPGCKSDSDCVYDKACINSNCLNPCSAQSCGHGAECRVQAHRAYCVCPAGTQGSPMISCVSVVCQYNEDCADHEACDRLNRRCRPVCEQDTCAEHATCLAQAHQPTCTCLSGFQGNPYIDCTESRVPITPECTTDSDCPTQHACVNQRCQNPCTISVLCSPDQECHVQDTVPYRTVMCQCRPDTVATIDGHCKPIVSITPQCKSDQECPLSERCVNQACVEACRIDPCGINAQCISQNHQAACSCPPGYVGNPHTECSLHVAPPILPPSPECTKNDDCATDRTCINQKCVSPCTLGDSCGRGSFCHTQNHQPVCRCPNGYTGDPRISCIPPSVPNVECVSNTECSPEESCINRLCVSPCNCGPNSDCKVYDHYPSCVCKPGYYGNPQQGCIKMGCTSDDQCAYDKQCYNGECVPPCLLNDPCAPTAKCYGDNHRAACQCPPGYFGNPFEKCERTECTYDIDCPSDRMCFDQHCINPCTEQHSAPCASNGICFAKNHAATCRCPDSFPLGDPTTYCERSPPPHFGEPECKIDVDCASRLACIKQKCVNPCQEIKPCSNSAMCTVLDSVPVRTMTCTCSEGWVLDEGGECKQVIVSSPPGCTTNDDCPTNEACLNRQCRNPCNCGTNAQCFVQNHHPVCSCIEGYDGNPNFACKTVGCKRNSECESGKACINGHCLNPCIVEDPCGPNAECFTISSRPECRCKSGYRGNPYDRCLVIGCRSNNDCPSDRSCINGQCINPCVYEHPCSSQAECKVQNHFALCRCPLGMVGNPYVACREEVQPECKEDADCPSLLACFDNVCQNPCTTLEPCKRPAECVVINSLPVRTMICECPSGYVSSGSGTCKITPPMTAVACTADTQCPSDRACLNGRCIDPCNCGPNSECRVWDHKPVCSCLAGFDGSPEIDCSRAGCRSESDCSGQHVCVNRICVAVCAADGSSCGTKAECYGNNHQAICECPPGTTGNPQIACVVAGCRSDTDCPSTKACINSKCIDPCTKNNPCIKPSECTVYNHRTDCACPPGYVGNVGTSCKKIEIECQSDSDCPSQTGCINKLCVNPCDVSSPCGINSKCTVLDTFPIRTMTCECLPGTQGNAAIQCEEVSKCPIDKGYVRNDNGECVCPPGTALNNEDECHRCIVELGFKVDERGRCVCALDRGLIIDERGRCVCPIEHGYTLNVYGQCVPKNTTHFKTDFPRPEMVVTCLSDGVQVEIYITDNGFNGVLYVKGHSKNEECRRVVSMTQDSPSKTEIFKVSFGNCGLIHVNGQASFVLVVQKHPKLVTYKAQAYHIRCVYNTGEQNVTLGFNVSMLTTAGTIANTGPPPTCLMKIVTHTGQEIDSAEIGDNLMLQVDVQPSSIYGGFARSCVAKTIEDNVENEYIVTDENGCATDPSIFGEWDYNADTQSLLAGFNAFKFPSSDNIRFQCNIRVCFGKCQPVNCRGYNAFGKRKRREISKNDEDAVDSTQRGQLREEITIESNAILTFERREERLMDPTEAPIIQPAEDICVSVIGLIVALVITALLALVAVAVAVSCWLMAYRRTPNVNGPLPHPTQVPNPMFMNHDQTSEPSPDYLT